MTVCRHSATSTLALALTLLLGVAASHSHAQLLYSFETGLDGFEPQGAADSDYISHLQSTIGATDGTMSLEVETGTGFGRDVVVSHALEDGGAIYDLFNTVSENPSRFTLDFDVNFTEAGWSRTADPGTFLQLNVFSNSDDGFQESFGVVNGMPGVASSISASLPATALSLIPNSDFYQIGFGTNGNHTAGANGEGVQYYLDNIRFQEAPNFIEKTLFSWETPDDVGTPAVNEQFEGWADGFTNQPYFHTRTITTDGVTDGASALQFESPQSGFAWGSQFVLDSGEEGDPSAQPQIDQLISDVNDADRIAFDVTFPSDGQFPNVPTFLSFFLNVSDQSGAFYQSPAKQAGNPENGAGETITIEVPLSELSAGGVSLADAGLVDGTFFRIALATNSDDGTNFVIDNLRLLSEISGLAGDYNNDGTVDAADYTLWRDNLNAVEGTLPNDVDGGTIGTAQYDTWAANYGSTNAVTATAVPEPAALVGLAWALLATVNVRRRCPSAS